MTEIKYTIAVDFDGVIHSYTSPWVSSDVVLDPPVTGAIEWLNSMSNKYKIVIFTTRAKEHKGIWAVKKYLTLNGFHLHHDDYEVTAVKPAALIYLDDRAVRFDGKNFPTEDQIQFELRPWNKRQAD